MTIVLSQLVFFVKPIKSNFFKQAETVWNCLFDHPFFSRPSFFKSLLSNAQNSKQHSSQIHFFIHHVPFMMIIPTIVSKIVATNKIFPINDQRSLKSNESRMKAPRTNIPMPFATYKRSKSYCAFFLQKPYCIQQSIAIHVCLKIGCL